jgi:hypothetical protein
MAKTKTVQELEYRQQLADILEKTAWSVTNTLCADIKCGKIPEDWNLQQLLPLLAQRIINRAVPMNRQQKREFGNEVKTRNL